MSRIGVCWALAELAHLTHRRLADVQDDAAARSLYLSYCATHEAYLHTQPNACQQELCPCLTLNEGVRARSFCICCLFITCYGECECSIASGSGQCTRLQHWGQVRPALPHTSGHCTAPSRTPAHRLRACPPAADTLAATAAAWWGPQARESGQQSVGVL